MTKFKAMPGSQGIIQVSSEYFEGYFYNLYFSAAAPSHEKFLLILSLCTSEKGVILSLFVTPYQIVEDGLNKSSLFRPFLFALCCGASAVLVAAC